MDSYYNLPLEAQEVCGGNIMTPHRPASPPLSAGRFFHTKVRYRLTRLRDSPFSSPRTIDEINEA